MTSEPQHYEGAELPDLGTLISETFEEFIENIGPYALAGVGHLLVLMPLTGVVLLGAYTIALGLGLVVFVGLGIATTLVSDDLAIIGMLVGQFGIFGCMFVLFLLAGLLLGAVMAPLNGSMIRSVARHQRGEAPLTFTAAFSDAGTDAVKMILATWLLGVASLVGLFFCYLPVLLVPLFLGFVTTMVALHGSRPREAAAANIRHVLDHLEWHLPYFLISIAMALIANYIPILGPMFLTAFHCRTHRHLFGDAASPNLA